MRLALALDGDTVAVEVVEREGGYRVRLGEEWLDVDAWLPATGPASLRIEGESWLVDLAEEDGAVLVTLGGRTHRVEVEEGRRRDRARAAGGGGQRLVAPMPGRVVAVHVRPGDRVEPGAPLIVLEAMKMENEFRATAAGTVSDVTVVAGQAVNAGDLLVVVTPPAA
jgi:biotin carboxyl carrier protein